MHIYAVASYAHRKTTATVRAYPFAVRANSAEEAEAAVLPTLLNYCPRAEGWSNHESRALQVPNAWLIELGKETPAP